MNKLHSELHRLYAPQLPGIRISSPENPEDICLIDAEGWVRAMVLELARPAAWEPLAAVWQGVQIDLDLPAPAIAVSGTDGYQLWFSLAQPVPVVQAAAFLESLRRRYLGDIEPRRLGLLPALDAASPLQARHARPVPSEQGTSGRWSAFVAPDLAPVFAAEPWIDIPPSPEGQSKLLSRLHSVQAADFALALERLRPAALPAQALPAPEPAERAAAALDSIIPVQVQAPAGGWLDPKRFLLDVMNNESVALGLRIEAAKALLPGFDGRADDSRRS